ncbi:hypothetical protein Bsph_3872 [Lysinibacillus sphaericus C3-41]|nr:hypothetical protein Bsph_3872 [Lysinibacillus sphaericus C3-41]
MCRGITIINRWQLPCWKYREIWCQKLVVVIGGVRPDMAMAGAKDASKLDEALLSVYDYVKSI